MHTRLVTNWCIVKNCTHGEMLLHHHIFNWLKTSYRGGIFKHVSVNNSFIIYIFDIIIKKNKSIPSWFVLYETKSEHSLVMICDNHENDLPFNLISTTCFFSFSADLSPQTPSVIIISKPIYEFSVLKSPLKYNIILG